MKNIYQNPGGITLYENLPKFWQWYIVWKKFTKILAILLSMKIYENPGNDIVYENLQKSWQWPLVWKIYENPGNDIQYENNLRKSWQLFLIWGSAMSFCSEIWSSAELNNKHFVRENIAIGPSMY